MTGQPKPHRRKQRHHIPASKRPAYRQLWRIVDGAVFDALYTHQDYLTPKGRIAARESIVKRVTGAVLGFAEQSARGRSGESPAADRDDDRPEAVVPHGAFDAVSKWRATFHMVARLFRLGGNGREAA